MIRFLTDENFNGAVTTGVRLRLPGVDLVRVQEVGLMGADDPNVLAWAAADGRIVLTHDVRTMSPLAWDRVARGEPMPGVIEVHNKLTVAAVIDELVLVAVCSVAGEWADAVHHLPLR